MLDYHLHDCCVIIDCHCGEIYHIDATSDDKLTCDRCNRTYKITFDIEVEEINQQCYLHHS
jgi:hypothetical protein